MYSQGIVNEREIPPDILLQKVCLQKYPKKIKNLFFIKIALLYI